MKSMLAFLLLALIYFSLPFQLCAQPAVSEGKVPAWVTAYEYTNSISNTVETSNGYAYLLISKQSNLETKELYCEYVMKVTSAEGLSMVSSINESFDPSFYKIIFHKLNVIRNGKKINRLDVARFDVIRREEDMDRAVYDKSVNAIYNLPDVRVGDIVEYSFTRKGSNPVFNDHSFGSFYLQYGIPVAKFGYKVVYDPHRQVRFKTFGELGATAKETHGLYNSVEWIRENVPALLADDRYPAWFDPYAHVQFSDFQSWNELNHWAATLFDFPELRSGELKGTLDSIRASSKSDEEKIKACIRIAQGDIRYLSFSDGINSYKPHAPETVYRQKYGDCKDKSFMLSLMLNELGINSKPALVSTENGYALPEMLPNPWAFNHCIVQFTYNDSTYWVDPTLNAQVGPLNSYFFPSYYHALVVGSDRPELTPIPFGYKNSNVDITEEYSMDEVGGFVTLKVQTIYHGDRADEIRSYFKSSTVEQIDKDYLNFYARDFSEISISKDVAYTDNPLTNIIESSEEYLIKDFWEIDGKNKSATVYASVLATYLQKPETRIRTMPLAITYPCTISQTVRILLPEEWNLTDSHTEIESDAFTYTCSKYCLDKTITMRYYYSTKASFIAAENVAEHIKKTDQVLADNGLQIYKPLGKENKWSTNAYVIVILAIAAGAYVMRKKF